MSYSIRCSRFFSFISLTLLSGILGGCNSDNRTPLDVTNFVQLSNAPSGTIGRAFLIPGGDYSLVTVRERPNVLSDSTNQVIICTAPSPDWATAIAKAQQLQAEGSAPGGPSASLAASTSLTETISAMAGRSAGVVALRDGLYKACEAYANGVIGKDAYALILSQYGNLLVALAGGPSGTTTSGTSSPAPATTGLAVAVSAGAASGTPGATGGTKSSTTTQTGNPAISQMQLELLQSLMVACISESDLTLHQPGSASPLLNSNLCGTLLSEIAAAGTNLLKPPMTSTNPAGTQTQTSKKPAAAAKPPVGG